MKFSINTYTLYQAKETSYNSEAKKAAIFIDEFIKRYIENPLESFNINVYHDRIINYRIGMAVKFENERMIGVYLYDNPFALKFGHNKTRDTPNGPVVHTFNDITVYKSTYSRQTGILLTNSASVAIIAYNTSERIIDNLFVRGCTDGRQTIMDSAIMALKKYIEKKELAYAKEIKKKRKATTRP